MMQQAQFSGSPFDNPNIHLVMFLEICDTVKINGVTEDTIRLRPFPFSLRDKARDWLQVQMFYNGLNRQTRTIVDVAVDETLMSKTTEGATYLLEEMVSNNYQWPTERIMAKKVAGIYELELLAAISAQVATLSHQISALTTQRIP
ncbi:uncharacterized protein LOC121245985 [Juglans microcarpa x Juglans regia]|uniref:uncharacterized protein LOC121245985 n=1 Tax=Juglans microcarpa x Juglans regia TaxID=2249226 RepID=UPI001B7E7322|nr:uncharacterized protein LOC121245985 [Juglans microcarpa x Juglans regia]